MIMPDELVYSEMARSFADGEGLEIRGVSSYARTLYPVLISPAWLTDSVATAFGLTKLINTALMTLACIPMYLWARRFLSRGWAAIGAGMLLLLPAFAYTGTIMTESAALPLFLLAFWLTARALETPTAVWQLSALAAALAAGAVRLQGLVLVAIFVTAVLLRAVVTGWDGQPRRRAVGAELRAFASAVAALLALAAAFALYAAVWGGGLAEVLGGYRNAVALDYSLSEGLRWTVFHAAELVFAVAVLPAAAFLVLSGMWLRPGSAPAERAFACVAAAALLWIVPQAGFFASRYSERIEERAMFYLEPLLLLALVAWVARGAPRPPRTTAVAILVPVALLVAIPFEHLFGVAMYAATFGMIPLFRVSTLVDGGNDAVRVLLAIGGIAAGLLFVLVPRRLAATTIGAVAVFLAMSAWSVAGTLRDQANATRQATLASDPDWIDDEVGRDADAAILFTPEFVSDSHPVWQTEFWNRSVGDVYGLGAADPTSVPVVATRSDSRGRIVKAADGGVLAPRYVVAPATVDLAGEKIAGDGVFSLFRTSRPLRLGTQRDGVYADGWSGPSATYTNFSGRHRSVDVDVGRAGWSGTDVPGTVTIAVEHLGTGRRVSAVRWVVHSGAKRSFRLAVPPAPFRVKVDVDPTFSPSTYGVSDTRQLGVQVSFTPRR